jgi:hypothetical protein
MKLRNIKHRQMDANIFHTGWPTRAKDRCGEYHNQCIQCNHFLFRDLFGRWPKEGSTDWNDDGTSFANSELSRWHDYIAAVEESNERVPTSPEQAREVLRLVMEGV